MQVKLFQVDRTPKGKRLDKAPELWLLSNTNSTKDHRVQRSQTATALDQEYYQSAP